MSITLRPHQQRFLDANPDKAVLFWACRAGKTIPAVRWSKHPRRSKNVVVVCKKSNQKEWMTAAPHARVMTKEEFKRDWEGIKECSAVVVDELHHLLAPLFIPKERSALSEAMYYFLQRHDPHFLGLTATPLTNRPASLHTLLTFLGKRIDWKENFRPKFYSLESRPYLPRPAWLPQKDWRERAERVLEKYTDKVTIEEVAPYLPAEEHIVVNCKGGKYPYAEDEERNWQKDHQGEQMGDKLSQVREIGERYRKVIVVAKYTEQIDRLAKELKKDKPVYVLDGRTKQFEQTVADAQAAYDNYLIVQSEMGEGYDGYRHDAMVFASMSHRHLSWEQMKARLVHLEHPKPRVYYYLIAGKWDRAIYEDVVKRKTDFAPPKDQNNGA